MIERTNTLTDNKDYYFTYTLMKTFVHLYTYEIFVQYINIELDITAESKIKIQNFGVKISFKTTLPKYTIIFLVLKMKSTFSHIGANFCTYFLYIYTLLVCLSVLYPINDETVQPIELNFLG